MFLNLEMILEVKYFGIDPRTRKEKVSRKALLESLKVMLKDHQGLLDQTIEER